MVVFMMMSKVKGRTDSEVQSDREARSPSIRGTYSLLSVSLNEFGFYLE